MRVLVFEEERETYKKTQLTLMGLLRRQFEADKAKKEEGNKHTIEGKLGHDCLLFSKVGDVYLYVDDGKVEQVRYK